MFSWILDKYTIIISVIQKTDKNKLLQMMGIITLESRYGEYRLLSYPGYDDYPIHPGVILKYQL